MPVSRGHALSLAGGFCTLSRVTLIMLLPWVSGGFCVRLIIFIIRIFTSCCNCWVSVFFFPVTNV